MASPQQPAPPRHSRGFSFGGRSDKSSNSGSNKIRLTESAEEKHKRSLHTKADPMVAMSEAQPSMLPNLTPMFRFFVLSQLGFHIATVFSFLVL